MGNCCDSVPVDKNETIVRRPAYIRFVQLSDINHSSIFKKRRKPFGSIYSTQNTLLTEEMTSANTNEDSNSPIGPRICNFFKEKNSFIALQDGDLRRI